MNGVITVLLYKVQLVYEILAYYVPLLAYVHIITSIPSKQCQEYICSPRIYIHTHYNIKYVHIYVFAILSLTCTFLLRSLYLF